MRQKLFTAGWILLLLLHAPVADAAARTLSPVTVVVEQSATVALQENTRRVSRGEFLRLAVDAFYGATDREFSAPYANIPEDARNAIGLARSLGAVREGGSAGQWDQAVTRGEMLDTLFKLARMEPQAGGQAGRWSDVRGTRAERLAAQAESWNLLTPLTSRTFGWSRAVPSAELQTAIEHFGARLKLPLSLPELAARPVPDRSKLIPRERPARSQGTTGTSPGKITIERSGMNSGRSISRTDLPRNDLLKTVWGIVQEKFLYQDRIDQDEIAYSIAETILQKLGDPYTTFLRPKSNERFQEQIEGGNTFFGIGAHVRAHAEGGVEIVTPLQASPAMKAGVLPGDRIVAIDGVNVEKMELNDAIERIRGQDGTTVKLTIIRKDMGSQMIIPIVRAQIVIRDLIVSEQESIAIVQLNNFSREAQAQFNGAMKDMMAKVPAPKGVILDLRNDPGGLLDAAILVASHFLKEGDPVVSVKRRNDVEVYKAVGGQRPIPMALPVIVLVNKGSASASEIVAGALKDHKRAEIMGQTTFGKGTVQEAIEFASEGGKSPAAVKITVAKWLTPSGHEIDGKGVAPTIIFPESQQGDRDEMLLEAIRIIKAKKGR